MLTKVPSPTSAESCAQKDTPGAGAKIPLAPQEPWLQFVCWTDTLPGNLSFSCASLEEYTSCPTSIYAAAAASPRNSLFF